MGQAFCLVRSLGGRAIDASRPKEPVYFFGLQMDLTGLAFHLSWLFLFLYSAIPVGAQPGETAEGGYLSSLYLFSSFALTATLLAFILFRGKSERLLQRHWLTTFGIVATTAGTLLYYAAAPVAANGSLLVAQTSGLLTGVGSGIIAMRWAWDFGGVPSATIMSSVPSILAVTVVCCVTTPHLPPLLAAAIVSLLPVASGVFALNVIRTAANGSSPKEPLPTTGSALNSTSPSRPPNAPAARSMLFYTVLCGGIALLGTTLGITGQSSTSFFSLSSVTVLLISAAGAILIGSALVVRRTPGASFSANLFVPFIVIVCFLVILASTQPEQAIRNAESVGRVCLETLFFAVLINAARRFAMPAITVFAAGRVTYALSSIAGSQLTGLFVAGASSDSLIQLSSFALFLGIEIIMVAAVVVVVLPRRTNRKLAHQEGTGPIDYSTLPKEPLGASLADNPSENIPPANAAFANDPPNRVPFQERVTIFSREYGLTAREAEVAKQLLMGHSYARIMQELCIAEGTVNYHARNIYSKAGVHGRQELVELFETNDSRS